MLRMEMLKIMTSVHILPELEPEQALAAKRIKTAT